MQWLYTKAQYEIYKKQYVGTADYGTAEPEPADSLAMETLVFMIV